MRITGFKDLKIGTHEVTGWATKLPVVVYMKRLVAATSLVFY